MTYPTKASRSEPSRRSVLGLAGVLLLLIPTPSRAGLALNGKFEQLHPGLITSIQRVLKDQGFLAGPPDGKWTPKTRQAFERFCRSRKLAVTDRLTREQIQALWNERIDPDKANIDEIVAFLQRIGVSY